MAAHTLWNALVKPAVVLGLGALFGLGFCMPGVLGNPEPAFAADTAQTQSEPAGEQEVENTQESVDEILTVEGVARMGDEGPALESGQGVFLVDGVDLEMYQDKRVRITGLVDTDEQNRRWLVVEKFELLKE